jgi:hypothetical protein
MKLGLPHREAHRLTVFEYKVPKEIPGPKRHTTTRRWRKLHYKEFQNSHSIQNVIKATKSRYEYIRRAEHATRMKDMGNTYRISDGTEDLGETAVNGMGDLHKQNVRVQI